MKRLLLLLAAIWLAACASLPPPPSSGRTNSRHFALQARFTLKALDAIGEWQSAAGRLDWLHQSDGDRILLATPLGSGLAEITIHPGKAELRTADGKSWDGEDAESVLQQATGQTLPLQQLPTWLLGQAGRGELQRDQAGRPTRLLDGDWRIEYGYDGDDGDAIPGRLTIFRAGNLELRLRIEEWRALP